MKCLKFRMFFGLFVFLSFFFLLFSSSVSAISDVDYTLDSNFQTVCSNNDSNLPNCSDYNIISVSNNGVNDNSVTRTIRLNLSSNCSTFSRTSQIQFYSFNSLQFVDTSSCAIQAQVTSSDFPTVSYTLTLTNPPDEQDCPVCEECQECPVIPDNPYDDKLDQLIVAIYVVSGTLLVIYFFYCIYRIIIKAGKK